MHIFVNIHVKTDVREHLLTHLSIFSGLKKMAVDNAGDVPMFRNVVKPTGKKVAIIGGGPGGLSAGLLSGTYGP